MEDDTMGKRIKNGKYAQSGGIVYKLDNGISKFLMVTSLGDSSWVLPKGHIEDGEGKKTAAIREVYEESGIWAKIIGYVGDVEYSKADKEYVCSYYLMEYIEDGSRGPEPGRSLEWFTLDDIILLPTALQIKAIIRNADALIKKAR